MKPVAYLFFIAILLAASAQANVPMLIQHQGTLQDAAGQPVNGQVTLVFRLYWEPTGGTPVWMEAHSPVPVSNGLYSVLLGGTVPLTDDMFIGSEVWLGTTVNADAEMQPRIRVTSVPFSMRTAKLESVSVQNAMQVLQLLNNLPDADSDGHTKMSVGGDDCDDLDPNVYAGATEICDGKDNNCDRQIDEGFQVFWYLDADGDGYGTLEDSISACSAPPGYAALSGDCDDGNPAISPGVQEICPNGIDDNCNGAVDEGGQTWYADADQDGYGNPNFFMSSCVPIPGFVADYTDCDDTNPNVNPSMPEVCLNGLDDDCDGMADEIFSVYPDVDGDGYGDPNNPTYVCNDTPGYVNDGSDCDDNNASIHPGAPEVCNGVDDNCDGQVDNGVGAIWYRDFDLDGFGDPATSIQACNPPNGYVSNNGDCDDYDPEVHPGAPETCNGVDDDCDSVIDEGFLCPPTFHCANGECVPN